MNSGEGPSGSGPAPPPSNHLTKEDVRAAAYQGLRQAGAARFPFPIEGRIPNFTGAEDAARRLARLDVFKNARAVKVNPDSPQLPVRALVLRAGKILYMPSPRLKGGFLRILPENVPPGEERRAASLRHCRRYGEEVPLKSMVPGSPDQAAPIDLVVVGSVAVSYAGSRAGKGHGYGDLEYAILRDLGHGPLPVATTVHPSQITPDFVTDGHDLPVDWIITPEETTWTGAGRAGGKAPHAGKGKAAGDRPPGVDWSLIRPEDMDAMPVLRELREIIWPALTVPDVIKPSLKIIFVGINPGRMSAIRGRQFAGPGNYFWPLLHDAGLTPRLFTPEEDHLLPDFGLGVTNIVQRASRGQDDLSWDEMVSGAARLKKRIATLKPRITVLLGKQVYRAYAGLRPSGRVEWGLQDLQSVPGIMEYAAPNPSRRSTLPYDFRLQHFQAVRSLVETGPGV